MIKSIYVLAFVLIQSLAMSQSITNYTTVDGLPDNDVTCLVHDGNGTMWFGTQKGVAAFDGVNWVTYTTESDSAIPQDAITAIAIGNNSDIWIGTDAGAAVYDGSEWKAFTTTDGLGSNRINHIATMSNGDIWFSEFNGATKYDGITFKAYSNSDGLPFGGVVKIAEDNNGDILMCTGLGGLVTFDGTNFTAYSTAEGLVSKNTTSLAIDAQGNKWIGTAKGVTVLNSSNQWVTNQSNKHIADFNQIDETRRGLYSRACDPLIAEANIKRLQGDEQAALDMEAQALAARIEIQNQHPWP